MHVTDDQGLEVKFSITASMGISWSLFHCHMGWLRCFEKLPGKGGSCKR